MRTKLAGWPGSVSPAVLTLTRGISSTFVSMYLFTPTMPAVTRGSEIASATAKRPNRTRTNDRTGSTNRSWYRRDGRIPRRDRSADAHWCLEIRSRRRAGRRYPARVTPGAPLTAAAVLARIPASVDAAIVRAGTDFVVAADPDAVVVASGREALDVLDRLPPGWWAGFLTYELGQAVERVAPRPHAGD